MVSNIAPPPMAGASKEEDTTCKRCPTRNDPKGLRFDMTERGEQPNMQWDERQDYHKYPK